MFWSSVARKVRTCAGGADDGGRGERAFAPAAFALESAVADVDVDVGFGSRMAGWVWPWGRGFWGCRRL